MEEICLAIGPKTAYCWVCDPFIEDLGQDLADVLASEVFTHQCPRQDDSFVHTADADLLVADVNHAGRADCSAETSHHALQVHVQFAETYAREDRSDQHLDVSADKNVRQDEDAVEGTPLLLRNLQPVLHEKHQQILKVSDSLFLLRLIGNVERSMCDDFAESVVGVVFDPQCFISEEKH